ncbi:HNH endonuclease signature motif containing protein [uncultured Amphritea sp.]|uniref:HNH endonuclease signature motif containing protein n=1 Tax=uncultured Amphritea sp. TaxID=981605 RepID=UPI002604AAB6|nr:HNH endonuclease signature motif containing protein [uncultured Amphritea sp.]
MKGVAIKYSDEELQWISDNRTMTISDMHETFIKTFSRSDVTSVNLHSLRKRKGWKTGRSGQFKKGNVPAANARPKGPNSSSFKKGRKPHTWKPIGTERLTKEGYLQRKVTDTGSTKDDYVEVHRIAWEELNGPIPKGSIIIFKDGDRLNCDPDNLMMISRAEHCVINKMGLGKAPADMKETVQLIAQLRIKSTAAV